MDTWILHVIYNLNNITECDLFYSLIFVSEWAQCMCICSCVCMCGLRPESHRVCVLSVTRVLVYSLKCVSVLHVTAVCSNKNMLDVYKITDDVVTRNRYSSDDNDDATLQRWKMIIHLQFALFSFIYFFLSSIYVFSQHFYVDRLFWSFTLVVLTSAHFFRFSVCLLFSLSLPPFSFGLFNFIFLFSGRWYHST